MSQRSNRNTAIKFAFRKGYIEKNGEIISPNTGKPLKLYVNNRGYPEFVCRFKKGGKYMRAGVAVHRLVAYHKYRDKLFQDRIEVRHLDGDRMNFHSSNIAIGLPVRDRFITYFIINIFQKKIAWVSVNWQTSRFQTCDWEFKSLYSRHMRL